MRNTLRILDGPQARAALGRGVDLMANLLRPTLGPLPRTVAIGRMVGQQPPEILDSAATIARRTIQLADPFEDMGGMIVRHLVWRVFDTAGDGGATAAVLAQSLVRAGNRYVAAGGSPVAMKRGIQRGLAVATAELRRQARTIDLPAEIANVVAATLRDTDLADMIGEVVEAVGPDGAIVVEDAQGNDTTHEYIDGVRWNEGYVSPFLVEPDKSTSMRVLNPRVLVTDYALERVDQLLPTLEACVAAGERNLFVVAPEVRDPVVGLLVVNRQRGVLENAVAVRAPLVGVQRTRILEDLAVITGGRCFCKDRHDRLADVTLDDLGKARQAWATRFAFGILGGTGSKVAIRQRIAVAKAELGSAEGDVYTCEKIKERIGKLAGTAAVIRVGAPSKSAQEDLKLRVEAAVRSARLAVQDGVVPGGGAALVACVPALEALYSGRDEDDVVGVKALAHALAEPMRAIVMNAGLEAAPILDQVRRYALDQVQSQVYDVVRREWRDAWSVGILDPLAVTLTALDAAVSAATSALTAEVLIRRRKPPRATEP